jgi:uncharacterized protein (DUF1501 family)
MKKKSAVVESGTSPMSRRTFLQHFGGSAALLAMPFSAGMLNLQLSHSAVAASSTAQDYKAIVCLFLSGGVDSYNVLSPLEDREYADYASIRGDLALAKSALANTAIQDRSGRRFAIHPGMPEIHDLYNQGHVAFVANVGSLVEPVIDKTHFESGAALLPLGMFSHSDFQRHWQGCLPQSRSVVTGWAGRGLDMFASVTDVARFMSISVGSNSLLATGNAVSPYVVAQGGAVSLAGYGGAALQDRIYTNLVNSLYTKAISDKVKDHFAKEHYGAIGAASQFQASVDQFSRTLANGDFDIPFPKTDLGASMRMVALAIGARSGLGLPQRQVFIVTMGGWDHHDEVLSNQARMLPEVSKALHAFYAATQQLGVENGVVTFTASDFGRSLSSNGKGSDHGWGGNQLVMGGSVLGGDIYGQYPQSLSQSDLDVGRGRFIPTTSVDEYAAQLAMWFGVANKDLDKMLPNIRNFGLKISDPAPLGFLTI